ncbi:hypothetical protein C1645_745603 [Glomus cerebriforme]|uniref:Uncharacterized protein n=1 Tax=Glomus cerebriforme TaxID=658196 RepID=A0A397S5B7_9GLOM|nr:hypothetical protein C1645_745603 [Glomus cerebriforme]
MANRKKMEKELYSKACVVESIRFVVDEAREESVNLKEYEKFSCNLATILAREKEVIAIRLVPYPDNCVVYIAKNDIWCEKDTDYINSIKSYLKSLSKDAPVRLKDAWKRDDVDSLFEDVIEFCSEKLNTRFEKLKKDITDNQHQQHIKSFIDYASIKVENLDEMSGYELSEKCSSYYKKVKNSTAPEKFLRHIKKVGSYYAALYDITACACKKKYKDLFSNLQVHKLNPMTLHQPIFSWKNIVERYTRNHTICEEFKRRCLNDHDTSARLSDIYGNRLDDESNEQHLCLHAEMNILANIINEKYKGSTFIAVSKRSCYLCELYIKFAQMKGYKIFTSGTHKKLYHKWMLPNIKDTAFKSESVRYIIKNLDRVINEEIVKHVYEVAWSDSEGEIENSGADPNSHEEADELLKAKIQRKKQRIY